jgi:hypothetical protein
VAELPPVDLVVCGSVAVNRQGARVGKGGGFSDLEFALLVEAGLIGEDTLLATTVHTLQVLSAGAATEHPRPAPPTDEDSVSCLNQLTTLPVGGRRASGQPAIGGSPMHRRRVPPRQNAAGASFERSSPLCVGILGYAPLLW